MEFLSGKGAFINDVTTLGGRGVHENMTFYDMGGGGGGSQNNDVIIKTRKILKFWGLKIQFLR